MGCELQRIASDRITDVIGGLLMPHNYLTCNRGVNHYAHGYKYHTASKWSSSPEQCSFSIAWPAACWGGTGMYSDPLLHKYQSIDPGLAQYGGERVTVLGRTGMMSQAQSPALTVQPLDCT